MSSSSFPDISSRLQNLPPIAQWESDSISICIYSSDSAQPSLNLSIIRSLDNHDPSLSFSVLVDFSEPICIWNSKSFKLNTTQSINLETLYGFFCNFIKDFLNYGPNKDTSSIHIPTLDKIKHFEDIFNYSFFALLLLICVYEAPQEIRLGSLKALANHISNPDSRKASKKLMKLVGSNIEEQWMRSRNLAITNLILELRVSNHHLRMLTPSFTYSFSTLGLWKVQLYCPIIAMVIVKSSDASADEQLRFSLRNHQLEGVIQFGYKVVTKENWVDMVLNVDNIRCDVNGLVSEALLGEQGVGSAEKHFPSRISLQITPTYQTDVISVSVSKSSENPAHEIGIEKGVEGGFDSPTSFGINVSASESMTMSVKPWRFEQSVEGYSGDLNWFLHDYTDGNEVFSSKPSKLALMCLPTAWFKNRYSRASRPFTRQGGIVFAGDEYGESVVWKVDKAAIGKTMEWEIKGRIWLTYWPNKEKTYFTETRMLEFTEILHLSLV